MITLQEPVKVKEFKSDVKPIWCPGCGDFGVLNAVLKAVSDLKLDPAHIAIASGIGCSGRFPAFVNAYGFHGVHGRVLPLATGIKMANPELTVFAVGGDGDAFSIGAGIAGLAGSLFAHFFRLLHPTTFAWMTSEMVVIMALVGGLGTLIGPIIGAGIVTLILELMRFAPEFRFVIWSVALIAVLIIEPRGLMGLIRRIQGGKK